MPAFVRLYKGILIGTNIQETRQKHVPSASSGRAHYTRVGSFRHHRFAVPVGRGEVILSRVSPLGSSNTV